MEDEQIQLKRDKIGKKFWVIGILAAAGIAVFFMMLSKGTPENEITIEAEAILLGTIAETEPIFLEDAMLYASQLQNRYESEYGDAIMHEIVEDEQTLGDVIKEEAIKHAVDLALSVHVARRLSIELTDEMVASYKSEAETYYDQEGLLDEQVRNYFYRVAIQQAVMDYLVNTLKAEDSDYEAVLSYMALIDPMYAKIHQYGIEGLSHKIQVRQIMMMTQDEFGEPMNETDKLLTYNRMNEILNLIESGEAFVDMVYRYSEDEASLGYGGELTFMRGDIMPDFEAAALALEPGDISPIIETEFGYHIIKLISKEIPTESHVIEQYEKHQEETEKYVKSMQLEPLIREQVESWYEDYPVVMDEDGLENFIVKGQTK